MIFDIRMPGMGGIELAGLVKQRRRTEHVPIIFLTAHALEDEDVLRAYGVGAVDYLSKPVSARILCSKVAVFIDLYRKTRALALVNHELQREVAARQGLVAPARDLTAATPGPEGHQIPEELADAH
jgi:CheY-like chemotaxis protein